VSLCLTPRIEAITRAVTGRREILFAADCARHAPAIAAAVTGKRVLVAGGAGSIGAATIVELLRHRPATIAVLDPNENNLAELVRTLRAQEPPFAGELLVEPLDYGSPLAARFLAAQAPFDLVLSFAALKHVRSERDAFSSLRLLEVNLLKADRFLAAVRAHGHGARGVFFVSTDKAARPTSLMGASKRVMEQLLWAHARLGLPASLLDGGAAPALTRVTTTRFANVAFSDGSLPWGFLQRLEKRQPLSAPGDVRRYLVSPVEAGQLCLLAALVCPHRHLLVPRLDPGRDLVTFTDIATATLRAYDLEPAWYDDPEAARRAVEKELARKRYPVVITATDTSGEKGVEAFVGADEKALEIDLKSAQAIAAAEPSVGKLREVLAWIDAAVTGGALPAKDEIVRRLGELVGDLVHRETGASLDGKM
jgi:FlaA1/EpsC-like NDP-sugar epimerase